MGFWAPVRYWLKNELREFVHELLGRANLKKRGIFNPKTVSKLIDDDFRWNIDASFTIFSLICIELWMITF